jgi:hypothetical protein
LSKDCLSISDAISELENVISSKKLSPEDISITSKEGSLFAVWDELVKKPEKEIHIERVNRFNRSVLTYVRDTLNENLGKDEPCYEISGLGDRTGEFLDRFQYVSLYDLFAEKKENDILDYFRYRFNRHK